MYSYNNRSLGCFNKKVTHAVNLSDVEMVVFENVNYGGGNAFQMAFVFKDVRIEPYVIRQILFEYLPSIQNYLLQKQVFYLENADSSS